MVFLEDKNEKEDVKSSMGKTTVQEFNFRKFVHFWAFLRGGGEGRFKKPENRQCFL